MELIRASFFTALLILLLQQTEKTQSLSDPRASQTTHITYQLLSNYQNQSDQCIILGQNIGWSMEEFDPLVTELALSEGPLASAIKPKSLKF